MALPAPISWLLFWRKNAPLAQSPENPRVSLTESNIWDTSSLALTGAQINERIATSVSTVYACVTLISSVLASLPLEVMRRVDNREVRDDDHPVNNLLRTPNDFLDRYRFVEMVAERMLLYGNGFSLLLRNRGGQVRSVLPLEDLEVIEVRQRSRNGRVSLEYKLDPRFEITANDGFVRGDDMLHAKGPGFDGFRSPSPIRHAARESVALSLAMGAYQSSYVTKGGKPSGTVSLPEGVSLDTVKEMQRQWDAQYGGVTNAGKTAWLFSGAKFEPLSFSQADAEILATRSFEVEELARIFGVPLHLIGHTEKSTSWGTGLEEQSTGFIRFSLRPKAKRIESELTAKLLPVADQGTHSLKFNFDALLRGTSKDRSSFLESAVAKAAWMTPNEARAAENLAPLDGGDELRQPTGAPPQNTDESETESETNREQTEAVALLPLRFVKGTYTANNTDT